MNIRNAQLDDIPQLLELQKLNFPEALWETEATLEKVICSTPLSKVVEEEAIIGSLLIVRGFDQANQEGVYIYDLQVHPAQQGKKLCSLMLKAFFAQAYAQQLPVTLHCMDSSLPIFSDEERMQKYNYKIVRKEKILQFYAQWGVQKDATYLRLEPIISP